MVETSVIIPTYHRKESLIRLLESIQAQNEKNIEVIVVEQGDNEAAIYRKIAKQCSFPFTYIFQKTASTSKAKNIGAKHAKGKYLIFYDDDVILQKDAIKNIIKNFSNPTIGGVAGRVVDKGRKEEARRTDVGRISLLGSFSDGFSSTIRQEVDTVIGCNAAWRKDIFKKTGGFDEKFTGNAMREESDLSLRIKKLGYRIVFDPSAAVVHMREPHGGARKADDRFYWYFHFFSNETYFFLKHRSIWLFPFFLLTRISYILRCMFGFGREVSIRSILTPWKGIKNGVDKYKDLYMSFRA
jgi:GT2 family glycosyltransferase